MAEATSQPSPPTGEPSPSQRLHTPAVQRRALAVLLLLVAVLLLATAPHGWRHAALAGVGVLLGATLHHARFGFASGYRSLLGRGDGRGVLAQLLLLLLLTLLFAPLLLGGLAQAALSPLALQAVVGAWLFGVGMQLGGACACGTLYALGGGSGLMLLTLASFSAGSFAASLTSPSWRWLPRSEPVSLLQRWGWWGVLAQVLLLIALILWLGRQQRGNLRTLPGFWPRPGWRQLLRGPWSSLSGAVALALLASLTLVLAGRPWGVTWGFTLVAAKVAQGLGWDPSSSVVWQRESFASALQGNLLADITAVMDLGLVLGAATAAAAAGSLRFRPPPSAGAATAALLGGLLMGYGAWLSFGCNVGAYLAGIASTSLHGWLWIVFALLGSLVGLRLRPRFGLSG